MLGQYVAANGKPGYLDDESVPRDSVCPTFAATTLWINNPRWEGVPFILKAGKGKQPDDRFVGFLRLTFSFAALNEAKVEIRMQFKDVTSGIFKDISRNELVIRIQPSEAVYLKLNAKTPGLYTRAVPVDMDLTYKRRFGEVHIPEAYEALILDALKGDHSNFVRDDELDVAWKVDISHGLSVRRFADDSSDRSSLRFCIGSRGAADLDQSRCPMRTALADQRN